MIERDNPPVSNTDREIWRERPGDYYADSVHVTKDGAIGMNVGGFVIVKPLKEWHRLAADAPPGGAPQEPPDDLSLFRESLVRAVEAGLQISHPFRTIRERAEAEIRRFESAVRTAAALRASAPTPELAKEFALDLEAWTWELFGTQDAEKLREKLRVILPAYAWKYVADYSDVRASAPDVTDQLPSANVTDRTHGGAPGEPSEMAVNELHRMLNNDFGDFGKEVSREYAIDLARQLYAVDRPRGDGAPSTQPPGRT